MLLRKSFVPFLILIVLLTSCSKETLDKNPQNDTPQDQETQDPNEEDELPREVLVLQYRDSFTRDFDDPNRDDITTLQIGTAENNKIRKVEFQEIIGEETSELEPFIQYSYQNDLIESIEYASGDIATNFLYDSNDQLIGITRRNLSEFRFFRFVRSDNNRIFSEELTHPLDDPQTEIVERIILDFDENDNIVQAGYDLNLDEEMDTQNIFSYVNNSITSVLFHDGQTLDYTYSPSSKKDTKVFLADKSLGKKTNRLLNAYTFSDTNPHSFASIDHSEFIPVEVSRTHTYVITSSTVPFYWAKFRNRPMGGGDAGVLTDRLQFLMVSLD